MAVELGLAGCELKLALLDLDPLASAASVTAMALASASWPRRFPRLAS